MRGRYYYFCSGGSIYTVSTVGRRGGRKRMGKYMKKAKSVKNMEVSQSSLLGVRTRARALALEKQTNESICKHSLTSSPTSSKPRKSSESHKIPLKSEPHYMQLRSRRLEKDAKHHGTEKNSAGDERNEDELVFTGSRLVDHAPIVFPSSCTPHVDLRLLNEELLAVPARNSCSSRPDFTFVGISSATAPEIDDASHSRVASPAQSCLHASNSTSHAAISTPISTMQRRGTSSRMVTRHQQQELDTKVTADIEVMNERDKLEVTSASDNLQRHIEIGPCFGESPTIAGPSGRERYSERQCKISECCRHEGPNTRSQKQECSPDNLLEVPVSTFRTGESAQMRSTSAFLRRSSEAPFSSEIEAFFASAEQNERRRFINGYNFDPLMEKPLKGRYLWLKE